MRFSLPSFALCLLSTQASFVFAGLCRPSSTTSVGEPTSTASLSEASTTTTSFAEASTTTLTSEASTITSTSEASTTTSLDTPEGTPLSAVFTDGSTLEAYIPLQFGGLRHITSDPDKEHAAAVFALEPMTSRLYATLLGGKKLYAVSPFPNVDSYGFLFDEAESVAASDFFDFVTCTEDSEQFLDCQSEASGTHIYFTFASSIKKYYTSSKATGLFDPLIRFRI